MTHDEIIERMAASAFNAWYGPDWVELADILRDDPKICAAWRKAIRAAFNAITDVGYAVVPVEATDKQLSAGQCAWLDDPARKSSTLYRAMVAAGRIDEVRS